MGDVSITARAVQKDDGTWDSTATVSMNVGEPRELMFAIPGIFEREGAAICAGLHYGMVWVDQELRL
jgi:hypothetical protein